MCDRIKIINTNPIVVVGATGPKGNTGNIGPKGNQGIPGQSGPTGATGPSGVTGEVGATGATGATGSVGPQGLIIPGMIVMFGGDLTGNFDLSGLGESDGPWAGWALCNGINTLVNLSGRFIVGYDPNPADPDYNNIGNTGGVKNVTLTVPQIPSHAHTMGTREANTGGTTSAIGNGGNASSSTTSSTGGNQAHENRPPYYTLAYVIKL